MEVPPGWEMAAELVAVEAVMAEKAAMVWQQTSTNFLAEELEAEDGNHLCYSWGDQLPSLKKNAVGGERERKEK